MALSNFAFRDETSQPGSASQNEGIQILSLNRALAAGLLIIAAVFPAACGKKKDADASSSRSAAQSKEAPAAGEQGPEPGEAPAKTLTAERPAPDPELGRAVYDRNAAHPELPTTAKIGGNEGRSPFEGDRVIKLNEIVARSLAVIQEFDRKAAGFRAAADGVAGSRDAANSKAAAEAFAELSKLYDQAKAAQDDMVAAEAELRSSGEYFDQAIFGGMTRFVADVEREVGRERDRLAASVGQ